MLNRILLSSVLVLLSVSLAVAGAQKNTDSSKSKEVDAQKNEYEAHRQYIKIHFDDDEMDFSLQWILGSISNGGCEIGEALYTISRIEDGKPTSWQQEWEAMAERVRARGDDALAAGHKTSAREAFLKASNYYRTALVSVLPDNPNFKRLGEKCRSSFKMAAKLFNPPVEYLELPFEGTVLPGYFMKVDDSGRKRKTLIMIGGGETFAEELYFYIAAAAIRRGYNFMTVDIPGQGMLPLEGLFFRADSEVPLKTVVDHALSREEVDPERLAMYGISGGGYFVPRAATVDKRIKAVVVNSAVIDEYRLFTGMPNAQATPEKLKTWGAFHKATASVVSWRWGLDPSDIIGLAEKNKGWDFDPSLVTCPALALIGAGEYTNQEVRRQQREFIDSVANPNKKLIVTPADEGASSHCIGENRSLMSQVVFNWLDELFEK